MTSTPFPVAVNALQKTAGPNGVATVNAVYQPSRIKRATAVEYAIGLEDTTVDVTWYPDDNNHFTEMIHPGIGNPGRGVGNGLCWQATSTKLRCTFTKRTSRLRRRPTAILLARHYFDVARIYTRVQS